MQQYAYDRVDYSRPDQHMSFNCEGPVNSLALNKDATMCVVAGRTVFRIVSIEDHGFTEKINLRVGKINLNYCAADVAWNHNDENILASAATNGSVVIWNLNKPNRSKQEFVFTDHKRTVNRVIFHKADSSLLLSGSQDGTMKLFDIRKNEVSVTFSGKMSDSVRDIQFCPHIGGGYFHFAAAYDNGNIELWDMRRHDRCMKQFPAHHGPAFSLDWHPEEKDLLATAGRDKMIQVWDTTQVPEKKVKSVQTIASVARVKWRPQRKHHIASASFLLDHNVNVWALGRPYIPFATFDGHKDVVSSIAWLDTHVFFTCGKDGYLVQHSFKDAKRPADNVIPSGVDVNLFGDVTHAYGEWAGSKKTNHGSWRFTSVFSKPPDKGDLFVEAHSDTVLHNTTNYSAISSEDFIQLATRYRLTKASFDELCDHNAGVARSLNRHKVAGCWSILHVLYCNKHIVQSLASRTNSIAPVDKQDNDKVSGKSPLISKQDISKVTENCLDHSSSDESDEYDETERDMLQNIAINPLKTDFFFGDGETVDYDYPTTSLDMLTKIDNDIMQDYKLPYEAIQIRQELKTLSPQDIEPDQGRLVGDLNNMNDNQVSPSEPEDENVINIPIKQDFPRICEPQIVLEMLQTFAEQGDIQTTVSMLIVLGDKIRQFIDDELQEGWFLSYIEILGFYELWTVSAEIIKCSHLAQVSSLNEQSTTIQTYCSMCNRPLTSVGWLCEKCRTSTNICSLCHLPVKRIFLWCQGCCHGGHIDHMKEWFALNKECPTGCGHFCQFT